MPQVNHARYRVCSSARHYICMHADIELPSSVLGGTVTPAFKCATCLVIRDSREMFFENEPMTKIACWRDDATVVVHC